MWNWFNCYLSGRHDFGVWCEPGAIFLRCVHCGRRSSGWAIDAKEQKPAALAPADRSRGMTVTHAATHAQSSRVLPFDRASAG